eukprot:Phypoly_transcript_01015.p1 GENE.Phypoly_transcript_01015~~Phypoly_transcript_01015.p1  ORF type:complete len:708 (+),score=135.75 Phypoly_transcript_01015:84-2207(+)
MSSAEPMDISPPDTGAIATNLQRYFKQLNQGCGRINCTNPMCASNPSYIKQDPTSTAVTALNLAKTTHNLCTPPPELDLPLLQSMIAEAKENKNYTPLIRKIGSVFSNPDVLKNCFLCTSLEGDVTVKPGQIFYDLDIGAVREAYKLILDLDETDVNNALISANGRLASQLKHIAHTINKPEDLRQLIILLENPQLVDPETHREILGPLLACIATLPSAQTNTLTQWFSGYNADQFRKLVGLVQQFITLHILMQNPSVLNREPAIIVATKVLNLLHPINEQHHFIQYTEFYNEVVNENIELKEDYINWKHDEGFTFCHYPFILDPGIKSKILQIESYMQMQRQRMNAINLMLLTGQGTAPYLVFRVRRNYLIRDTITQIALHPPEDLRKELKVQFLGEEGIDQGGVQKEFFQLIVRSIFDPAYGMFVTTKENMYWFNSSSQEFDDFKLIGTILGLALYNGVILDVHFPEVVYKKLINAPFGIEDLRGVDMTIYDSLQKLLAYEGNDVEDVFGLNFQVAYEVYGEAKTFDLKPGGGDIAVTHENKKEYVDLYVQYLLGGSVSRQFDAFIAGFRTVCNSPAFDLFRWEELELLICGSPELDFEELEKSTQYEGYDPDSPVIKNFWEVVHSLTLEQKKRLLFFTTGSDRSPIGGLGKLHLVISRHGPDSDRLPSAHTCFNHLLIPEYSSKDKLRDRLVAAISNAEGFGLM